MQLLAETPRLHDKHRVKNKDFSRISHQQKYTTNQGQYSCGKSMNPAVEIKYIGLTLRTDSAGHHHYLSLQPVSDTNSELYTARKKKHREDKQEEEEKSIYPSLSPSFYQPIRHRAPVSKLAGHTVPRRGTPGSDRSATTRTRRTINPTPPEPLTSPSPHQPISCQDYRDIW